MFLASTIWGCRILGLWGCRERGLRFRMGLGAGLGLRVRGVEEDLVSTFQAEPGAQMKWASVRERLISGCTRSPKPKTLCSPKPGSLLATNLTFLLY